MKFVEYRGKPEEIAGTLIELADRAALLGHCKKLLAVWPTMDFVREEHFKIRPYGQEWTDPDLGAARPWITHIVTIDGYGVMDFTDSAGLDASNSKG
jgi:hypothetical protein